MSKKCDMCTDSESFFSEITEMAKHFREAHGKFLCNICCTGYENYNGLKSHYNSYHHVNYKFCAAEKCLSPIVDNRTYKNHKKSCAKK